MIMKTQAMEEKEYYNFESSSLEEGLEEIQRQFNRVVGIGKNQALRLDKMEIQLQKLREKEENTRIQLDNYKARVRELEEEAKPVKRQEDKENKGCSQNQKGRRLK